MPLEDSALVRSESSSLGPLDLGDLVVSISDKVVERGTRSDVVPKAWGIVRHIHRATKPFPCGLGRGVCEVLNMHGDISRLSVNRHNWIVLEFGFPL